MASSTAPAEDVAQRRAVPWEIRLVDAAPLPPVLTGLLLVMALTAIGFAYHTLLLGLPLFPSRPEGVFPFNDAPRNALLSATLFSYSLCALGYGAIELTKDVIRMGIVEDATLDAPHEGLVASRRWGVFGVGVALLFNAALHVAIGDPGWLNWLLTFAPHLIFQMLFGWCMARTIYFVSTAAPDLARATREGDVDLLDLRPFHALGRIAVRNALLFIIGTSLIIPWIFVPGLSPLFLTMLVVAVPASLLLPLAPLHRVRQRIQAAKQSALGAIDAELRELRDANGSAPAGRMADLFAYRSHVEELNEWPLDASMLLRIGLYLLIPLASWVGSAFVERLVDTALD